MSSNAHHVIFRADSRYARRLCPVERRRFRPGEEIVVCPICDTAYAAESWDYVGGECQICGYREGAPMGQTEIPALEEISLPRTEAIAPASFPGGWLYLIEGYKGGRRYCLKDAGNTRIGRDPDNDVVLDYNFVSGQHALIRGDRGTFILYDLASTNGTWLNGERTYKSILYDGDVLTFSDSISLVFKQVRLQDSGRSLTGK